MEEKDTQAVPEIDLFEEPEAEKQPKKQKKKKSKATRIILWSLLGIVVLALIGGVYAWHICNRPGLFFKTSSRVTTEPTAEATPLFDIDAYLPADDPNGKPIPTVMPTATPENGGAEHTADGNGSDQLSGIVNIALFGIDAYESGRSTSGTMPHTDANVIVAVNFDTKEVSLISIARDCMTTIPGYRGFYKFNGVFNVGGGMNDPKAGFELSCRTAEEWIGGVSIPYYYGVDFQALIDLVDMIGGIDFNVDIKLYLFDGRRISPGMQHLDGMGVMAYMRMRKTAGGLDSKRTARQRKMLVAIFKKLKQEGKLSMIPDLLKTMDDNVYTNTTFSQTTSLVNFAKDIDPDSIKTYSIQGEISLKYDWAFCFIDQQARKDILKEVYGIDAAPIGVNSVVYERFLHKGGFLAMQYMTITERLFEAVHGLADADSMSEEQKTAYAACWKDYQNLQKQFAYADQWMQAHYDESIPLTAEEKQEQTDIYQDLTNLEAKLKKSANELNKTFDKPIMLEWNRDLTRWYDQANYINEVYVDFR